MTSTRVVSSNFGDTVHKQWCFSRRQLVHLAVEMLNGGRVPMGESLKSQVFNCDAGLTAGISYFIWRIVKSMLAKGLFQLVSRYRRT